MATNTAAPRKIVFKKFKAKEVKSEPKNDEESIQQVKEESTFILSSLNVSALDRNYMLPEIARKQQRMMSNEPTLLQRIEEGETRGITTSLEKLGISTTRKEPFESICWGDCYKIKLFVNDGGKRYELDSSKKMRCTWCHQFAPDGALMLAVPYKFVSSYIHEHVYSPECVNVVKSIYVETSKTVSSEKSKKTDIKSAPKVNYFRRDLSPKDKESYSSGDERIVINDYFETSKIVCSFNCLESKGRELAEKDPRFRNVRMHIIHLYQLIFGVLPEKILPAPSFENLEEYGGNFTVEEYRKNFQFITMNETDQYYTRAKELLNPSLAVFETTSDEL